VRVRERGLTRNRHENGRPEKAEKRLLKGRPQILFPCGAEGGKMRNLMESYSSGKVTAEFPVLNALHAGLRMYFPCARNAMCAALQEASASHAIPLLMHLRTAISPREI